MTQLHDKFMEKLITGTLDDTYQWCHLSDLYGTEEESNEGLYYLLFENEYRHIDYDISYYCPVVSGTIYLIYEIVESGRDGTKTKKYQLYLQKDDNKKAVKVNINPALIYQLANAVKSKDNSEELATAFMKSFINPDL